MRQTLSTLVATGGLLLTALAAPVLFAPADASTPAGGSARVEAVAPSVTAQPVQRGTRPQRDLHDEMVKKHGKIYFKGRVDPGHGPVIVQKKNCSSPKCHWHKFKKVGTHGPKNRWKVRVYAPRHGSWFWRGYVKAYGGYAKSWTGKWRTYVI
jgi:hypothetical protein